MAGWIKMELGMEVGLIPGDFVFDGDPAPSPKGGGAPSPIFGPFLLWPNGWVHQDATWYACRPQPRGLCVRSGPSPCPKRGGEWQEKGGKGESEVKGFTGPMSNYFLRACITPFKVIQGHRFSYQSKGHMRLPISD